MSASIKSGLARGNASRLAREARVAFGLRPKGAKDSQLGARSLACAEILFEGFGDAATTSRFRIVPRSLRSESEGYRASRNCSQ
jgi:hypothetical protein